MPKTSILINQKFNAYEVARHNVDLDYAALHAHIKNHVDVASGATFQNALSKLQLTMIRNINKKTALYKKAA